jgi:dTDP-4-amino-4,6-dideoxygalactose transaminase
LIPFLDLAGGFAEVEPDARRRIDGVLSRTQYVLGPETSELEAAMCARLGAGSAIAVSSGSDALSLALLALGIGAGDAVVLPAFTFFATAGAVVRAGALPVFCDIDGATFLAGEREMRAAIDREFDGEQGQLRHRKTGARLAALLPVHLYGRASDMPGIVGLARETGARVIEDAAQAIDCRLGGVSVGLFGDLGCFSFYPTKNLGGAGDGGLVACEDRALGSRIARLRSHGSEPGSYEHHEAGFNARMAELVAAVLNAKLARLDAWNARRSSLARLYTASLATSSEAGDLVLPGACAEESHVWHQYSVRIPPGPGGRSRRDLVRERLEQRGIAVRVFYPLPLHRQPCFAREAGSIGELPEADAAAAEVLCLPIYPSLADVAALRVAEELAGAVREA